MTAYHEDYRKKLITAKDAAALVRDGDAIELGYATVFPVAFDEALAERAGELDRVIVRNGVLSEPSKVLEAGAPFEWRSWHASSDVRRAIERGGAYHTPIRYSELPRYISDSMTTDIAVLSTTSMDAHGYFNFGIGASHLRRTADEARIVIVEVNPDQAYGCGDLGCEIHLDDVDYIIEAEPHPTAELLNRGYGELDRAIAGYVVERIKDGSTLQLGIGSLPSAVGDAIAESSLEDLAVHTEMYVDSFMKMTEAGKITGRRKPLDRGRQVYTFLSGSEALYAFADKNPELLAAPVDYVNDAHVIGAQHRMVSINTALHVNLRGEVSSESVGMRHISGAGGQLDFVLGSYLAPEGQSFICLKSSRVDKKGVRHSNIVADFETGTIVTVPSPITQYIVTEYGVANLKAKSTAERARALISIAHPDFRDALIQSARAKGIWRD